ncbi:nicotinate phosphoribosyltransferase [Natronocella acetinitrilica]|uniref:Nicotinate phosphoribosyltransferase n=1 Tax=Natronocella acetinitrilica TaxID=414046 RepID=A0AAE3G6V9_9GAMM|nr:nicotinate phosphoribosyltransferase [Natronocella acetinitrilica]MCP1676921.1 nicotinate phosphoribosyltransferase [Natronocella acetinitrilica]
MHTLWPQSDELALLTDLYELTMAQAYWAERMHEPAVFSLFFRKLPAHRNVMLACGQEHVARLVTELHFPRAQLDRLDTLGLFKGDFLAWLEGFRFSGDIHVLPEGTPVFPHEPLLEVRAPVIEAQLLETLVMNYINLETLLASKAMRVVLAADGRPVVDFGMRRMHGMDAALRGVRAYQVAGLTATSNVLGALRYGMQASGTMAHSFIQAHHDEEEAFRLYARLYPGTTLLLDTYDTLAAADKVIRLARDEGLDIGAVRLDSGDLGALARQVRSRFDTAGLQRIRIVVSGGLDEHAVQALLAADAPIDGFGVGTEMGSVADAPTLDLAYKLTEYAGEPRLKNSPGKQLVPGAKQVWRFRDGDGRITHDEITRRHEQRDAEPLLVPVVEQGAIVRPEQPVASAHDLAWNTLQAMPAAVRGLRDAEPAYRVDTSAALLKLRDQALAEFD